jgi:hypothetical protein
VKIILELSDFGEHAGLKNREWVEYALGYAYTIEVVKQPGREPEASFIDVNRQFAHRLVGPIDVELVAPTKETKRNRKTEPERND